MALDKLSIRRHQMWGSVLGIRSELLHAWRIRTGEGGTLCLGEPRGILSSEADAQAESGVKSLFFSPLRAHRLPGRIGRRGAGKLQEGEHALRTRALSEVRPSRQRLVSVEQPRPAQ